MNLLIAFILIASEISLILAHIGIFSIWGIILSAVTVFALCEVAPRTVNVRGATSHNVSVQGFALHSLPILIIAFLLFFQPYQYMDGGWDPGNYINTGVHIARTGNIVYHDEMLSETAGFIRADGTGIKYPGLYIKDAHEGLVVPQFFHLYPVWIAIFYKLFGLKAVFYVNPFFALLSVILIYVIGKNVIGKGYGLLSALLLSLNVIQIWNSRFPTSEILGQFFLLSGFYFWFRYLDRGDKFSAFWSGVSFGEFLFTGITSVLIIPIMIFYFLYRHNKKDIYFIIPFLFLLAHLAAQLLTYSSVYFETVMVFFYRKEIYFLVFLFVISFLTLFKIRPRAGIVRGLVLYIIFILFIYGYFIRPHMSNSLEALNLVEIGNWLSLFGTLVALLGLVIIIYRERNSGLLLFAITALIFTVFFIYDKRMNSRYPFSLRRYIPVVIPAYCIFVPYFCKKIGRFLSMLIIPLIIIIPLNRCWDIITVKDHNGWLKFWSGFASRMDNSVVYISNNYRWARPLSDIFGKDVVTFTGYSEFQGEKICEYAKKIMEEGKEVYYITDSNKPYSLIVDFLEIYNQNYKGRYIEDSLVFPPKIKEQDICFKIFKISEIGDLTEKEYTIDIGEEGIGLLGGFDKARRFSGIEGTARWTFGEARLVIPWFGDNVGQDLIIEACGMAKEAGVSEISIYINGRPVAENRKISEQIKEYSFRIPKGSIDTGNSKRVVLSIRSNTWSPSKYGIEGFPDILGILLDSAKISCCIGIYKKEHELHELY